MQRLKIIQKKLLAVCQSSYQDCQPPEYQEESRNKGSQNNSWETRTPIFAPSYGPIFYPSSTVVVNNGETKSREERKEEKDTSNQIIAVVGTVGLAFGATYLASQDEYINLWLADLDEEIESLLLETNYSPEAREIKATYLLWKKEFTKRTQPKTCGKAGVIASSAVGFGGLYLGVSSILVGGVFGATAAGCYLFWKYLKPSEKTDYEYYQILTQKVQAMIAKGVAEPSAPAYGS